MREATPDDLDDVARLVGQVREVGPVRGRVAGRGGPDGVRARCLELLDDPAHRVVLAVEESNGEVIGTAVLGPDAVTGLLDPPSVYVSHLIVAPEHRKRGAGHALVAAAAGYAEELGFDSVVVGVAPAGRDANRFFARLGFAPLVIRRVAPLATLRRTLGPAEPAAALRRTLGTEPGAEMRARLARRSARARAGLARALPRPRVRRTG